MAIEIKTAAADTASINNEMLFVVYESTKANDPVTYPDYSYVCDVYVDSTLVERLIARPDPTYKMGIFDISKALQPYISYGFKLGSDEEDYDTRLSYQLKFGEQYDGTLYTNQLTDSTRYGVKTYAVRPFESTTVMTNGIVSNRPSVTKIIGDDKYTIIPYHSNVSGIVDTVVSYYNSSGGLVSSFSVDNTTYTPYKIRQIQIGLSTPDVSYILITGNITHRVNVECSKHESHVIVWLNQYGAYESQTFGYVSKKILEISKKEFSQTNYRINASGEVSYQANNVYYGGKRGYAANVKVRLSLTSHLLNDGEYQWLGELFASPDVYIDDGTGKFIPVTIASNNYEYRTYKNSRLTPLQFEVEFSDMYNSQFL